MSQQSETIELNPAIREFVDGPQRLLIGDQRLEAADGRTFETLDPSTGARIASVPQAGAEDVDRAVTAAHAASEGWANRPAAERGRCLERLARLLEEQADDLAQLESLDNGKPVRLARIVDLDLAIEHLTYFAGWPTKIEGQVIPVRNPDVLCYTRKEPVGVCAAIVPWNFPLLMAVWKLAPAVAAGCTVILKPAEQTPLSALRLGELALEVGFPPGVINVITGDGETGAALVDHPGIAKISFTGSTAVGREIGAKAGGALKRLTLELGGKSPNIILPDADLDAAVKGSFQGMYFNTGQACNAGSRLFVQQDQFDDVVSSLAARAGKTRVGPGLDPSSHLGPLISAEQLGRVNRFVESGQAEGAELVAGGSPPEEANGGYFLEPTIFTATSDDLEIAREEIFGPVLVALPYDTVEEVAARANDSAYGLAAGVWTGSVGSAHRFAALLKAGSVYINSWGQSDAAAPFGGFKASGLGREHGRTGLDAYLETKTVWTSLR